VDHAQEVEIQHVDIEWQFHQYQEPSRGLSTKRHHVVLVMDSLMGLQASDVTRP